MHQPRKWPRKWVLRSLVLLAWATLGVARTTTTQPAAPGLDFRSFPASFSSSEFGVQVPMLPLTIEGKFRLSQEGAEGPILFFTDNVNPFKGVRIYVSVAGRLYFEVSDGTQVAAKTWSQQLKLNQRTHKTYSFKATATTEHLQVYVDGLRGRRSSGMCSGGSAECNLNSSWTWVVGQNPADPSTIFIGEVTDLKIRAMLNEDTPQGSSLDDIPDETVATTPNSDAAIRRLLPFLIALLVILICVLMMYWCRYWCWRQKHAAQTAAMAKPAALAAAPPTMPRQAQVTPARPVDVLVAPAIIGSVPTQSLPAKTSKSLSQASESECLLDSPPWWSVKPQIGNQVLEPVSEDIRAKVQELMNSTWRGAITKDRVALGNGKSVKHFEVVQVSRNENIKIWQQYGLRRREIARTMTEDDMLTSVLTEGVEGLGECEPSCNEFLLFHGSKPAALGSICENDFLLELAGSNRGTLYGPGLYFAESSSKADEYAEDDKEGIFRGFYAMLLCRVTLGKTCYTDAVRVNGMMLRDSCVGPGATYNSVLGDREKARGTYREFIVYATAQAYPEYVIIYRRRDVES